MIVKTGAGIVVGTTIGKVVQPVGRTFGTIGQILANGNESVRRRVTTNALESKSADVARRMAIETNQRKSLIAYGNETTKLNAEFNSLHPDAQDAIKAWQDQFPEVL
jgi:hypothetical protein